MVGASFFDQIYQIVTFIDSFLSIILTSIGIILLITKRKSIDKMFKFITNYSLQNTINELRGKLDLLNAYSADNKRHRNEIITIFHEIDGQIEGNRFIRDNFSDARIKLKEIIENPDDFSDAKKRYLMALFREHLKTLNDEIYNDFMRGKNE